MNDETNQTEIETTEVKAKQAKVVFNVLGEDGVTRNFGARANVVTTFDINEADSTATVTFAFRNGRVLAYTHNDTVVVDGETVQSKISKLGLSFIAEGIASKAKTSVSGVTEIDSLVNNITEKLSQFSRGLFISRAQGGIEKEEEISLNKGQTVFARIKGLAFDTQDAIKEVVNAFDLLSKEELKALKSTREWLIEDLKLTQEIAMAKLEALQA